jgi:uncharacterized protein YjiS (DUF1127 family)
MTFQPTARSFPRLGPSVVLAKINSIVGELVWIFATWRSRSAERRALRELVEEPRLLNDIGLSREQVLREAEKRFWRA